MLPSMFVVIVSATVLVGLFVNNEAIKNLAAVILFFTIIVAAIIVLFFPKKKEERPEANISWDNNWDNGYE